MGKIYNQISLVEREEIYRLHHLESKKISEIASILRRNKSSISRELSRCNDSSLGYIPDRAEQQTKKHKRRNLHLFRSAALFRFVDGKLRIGWSPEQIERKLLGTSMKFLRHFSKRMKLEKSIISVSYETIYKFAYSKEGKDAGWPALLPRRQPTRIKKLDRKPKREIIPNVVPIASRPDSIAGRKRIGHWEGDLVLFTCYKSNNLTTLVERRSRLAKLVCNSGKATATVVGGINSSLQSLPSDSVQSITFDRGAEFCSHENLGIKTYFCDPHSPWQKGGVENFNGRIRRFLPSNFDHKLLTQELMNKVENIMNHQPRKCLGFRTPFEVFYKTKTMRLVAVES